ncbi:E3 ubiquitin-protein ligase RNF114 isoform X2 [Pipra filicauda]|uniref:RING-type E3 ubiquitin transferase n=1 Tax=Pipra filicauda TaxID=649802 RepID=A0A7R5KPZ5_9PASS|nr:E3 ubiquitin-protein ligase RNF114 isoform X2 [Pipra filicauda]
MTTPTAPGPAPGRGGAARAQCAPWRRGGRWRRAARRGSRSGGRTRCPASPAPCASRCSRAPCASPADTFCTPCLQECLKPKKPVCGVCRSTLSPGSRALDLEKQIETTETTCNGCNKKMYLSKMRSHAASCSKYQNYIMEGVKAVTKEPLHNTRNFPNRFTFPCPYCSEKNFDQEGLVEHCKALHSMDAKQVVIKSLGARIATKSSLKAL